MAKETHTHRGHCQLCACVQAINPDTGRIAKHGYTVTNGYFNGTCPGSDVQSLHESRKLADAAIKSARQEAITLTKTAEDFRTRTRTPAFAGTGKWEEYRDERNRLRSREALVPFADAEPYYQREAIKTTVRQLERRAENCIAYAKDLEEWAGRITGKVGPYAVKDLEPTEWKVGDSVRIGGKSKTFGFDATIEAIERQPLRTIHGYIGNAMHAQVTRPARPEKKDKDGWVVDQARPAYTYWEPLRNLRRPVSKLAEELKKAGKL